MDQGRKMQLAIWSRWTPVQRLAAVSRINRTLLALRDRRLRQVHPGIDEAEFRRLRVEATLRASPSLRPPA